MTIVGGVFCMMFSGSFFLWASISIYVLSYLHYENEQHGHAFTEVGENVIYYVDLALVLLNVVGYNTGAYLLNQRRWNPKAVLLLGGTISISGFLVASFTLTFPAFIVAYGCVGALGCGLNYMVPLVCSWEHFPEQKGLVSGIIIGSYGLGSLIYTFVAKAIANPDNLDATIKIDESLSYFDERVAKNVPMMLRVLSIIWACQMAVAIALVNRPEQEDNELDGADSDGLPLNQPSEEENAERIQERSVSQSNLDNSKIVQRHYELKTHTAAFYSIRFYQFYAMMTLGNVFGGIFSYQYKPYGLANHLKDDLLTDAAAVSSFTQCFSRLFIGFLYDKFGFKILNIILMTINILTALLSTWSVKFPALYFIFIQLNYLVIGGIFALFPAPAVNIFGKKKGAQVYTIIILGSLTSSLIDTIFVVIGYDKIGVEWLYNIGAIASFLCLIITLFFKE